jgi:hypothetical protein
LELVFTVVVFEVVLHVILSGFESYLTRYKGVEPAVFYFFSQVIAECIRIANGLRFRFVSAALKRFRSGAWGGDQKPEEEIQLIQ